MQQFGGRQYTHYRVCKKSSCYYAVKDTAFTRLAKTCDVGDVLTTIIKVTTIDIMQYHEIKDLVTQL